MELLKSQVKKTMFEGGENRMKRVNYKTAIKMLSVVSGVSGVFLMARRTLNKDETHKRKGGKCNQIVGHEDSEKTVYDEEGYDKQGFSAEGYNRAGRDRQGFDREGYDEDGFNYRGYDREGYRRNGFSREGYNRAGFDYQGYGRNGYNEVGMDRAKCNREFYSKALKKLRYRLDEAYQQLQRGPLRYSLYDARVVLEETLKLIVQHKNGTDYTGNSIFENMKICERREFLGSDKDFMNRLHEVRHICNFNGHEFAAEENLNYNKVYFVIMQIKDLLNLIENIVVNV